MRAKLIGGAVGLAIGLQAATQAFAWTYRWDEALGPGLPLGREAVVYAPWSILAWKSEFGAEASGALARSAMLILFGGLGGLGLGGLGGRRSRATPDPRVGRPEGGEGGRLA